MLYHDSQLIQYRSTYAEAYHRFSMEEYLIRHTRRRSGLSAIVYGHSIELERGWYRFDHPE